MNVLTTSGLKNSRNYDLDQDTVDLYMFSKFISIYFFAFSLSFHSQPFFKGNWYIDRAKLSKYQVKKNCLAWSCHIFPWHSWAHLFEGRLALNPGFLFLVFKSIFSDNFLCYYYKKPIINLLTERIKLNLPFELSNLNSNFAITLGYI